MNKIDYENKVMAMLGDTDTYTEINTYDSSAVKSQADTLLFQLFKNGYIDKKQYKYLFDYTVKCPVFYGIPKLHKQGIPLRPIVSQINSSTYMINKYIHELLLVAEKNIPHLFQDTTAFLNLIEKYKYVPNNTKLVTLDVVSLYTNIPHDEAITYICEQYEDTIHLWNTYKTGINSVSVDILQELLQFILSNCAFSFNGKYYTQNYGLPMGAPAAVRIANIFMYKHLQKFTSTYKEAVPDFIGRLVDDIFFLWHHSDQELQQLFSALNTYHNTIKFELNYSDTTVNFLDVNVFIKHNTLHTTIYTKPTDKKQYLHYTSDHPRHIKSSIPYAQALRYRRIIDQDDNLDIQLQNLHEKFVQRNYPNQLVSQQIDKVKDIQRKDTLVYKSVEQKQLEFTRYTNNKPFLPLIITYNHKYTVQDRLIKAIKPLWENLCNNTGKLQSCFQDNFPKIVYSKGTTLANILIKANYNNYADMDNQIIRILAELDAENQVVDTCSYSQLMVHPCGVPRCSLCKSIAFTNSFKSNVTGHTYNINTQMNCNSTHTIYLITCTKCQKQYVGETARKLKERINNHRSDIRTKKRTAVGIHFNKAAHSFNNFSITPLEIEVDITSRRNKEISYINTLQTRYPLGLNYYPL